MSIALTAISGILGSIPLRVLRKTVDHKAYWIVSVSMLGALMLTKAYWLGASFFAIAVLIGLFSVLHNAGFSFESSGLASVSFVSSFTILGLYFVDKKLNFNFVDQFKDKISGYLEASASMGGVNVDKVVNEIVTQIPSGIFLVFLLSLVCALLLEKKVMRFMGSPIKSRIRLINIKVPDFFIFIFIGSVFGSFYSWPTSSHMGEVVKAVSLNLLNVMIMLYFFQGLAVVATYFIIFKVSMFWRVVFTMLFVTQLFLFVGLLGVADYWMDFRLRMARKFLQTGLKQ